MRTIKFRAYNKEYKRMFSTQEDENLDLLPIWIRYPERYELMQFTGLTDKNGVEIYEGDITKQEDDKTYDGEQNVRQVYFADGSFWAGNMRDDGTPCIFISLRDFAGEMEIIGNIFENNHLLV